MAKGRHTLDAADRTEPPTPRDGAAAPSPPAAASPHGDPGERGTLIVHDKVAERVAARAALDTDGVLAHGSGLDKITGRERPRVRVMIAGNRVRAHLDIAAAWPRALPQLGRQVQDNVATALRDFAGLHVDGVEVAITHLLPAAPASTRSVQ